MQSVTIREAVPPDGPRCRRGPRSDDPSRDHCQSHTRPRSRTGHSAARCSIEGAVLGACRHDESGWCRRGWPRVWPLACAWPVTWPVEARGRGRQRAPDEGCNHQHALMQPRACTLAHAPTRKQPRACNHAHATTRMHPRACTPTRMHPRACNHAHATTRTSSTAASRAKVVQYPSSLWNR